MRGAIILIAVCRHGESVNVMARRVLDINPDGVPGVGNLKRFVDVKKWR